MLLPLIAKTNKIRQHKSKRKGKGDEKAEETEGRSVSQKEWGFSLDLCIQALKASPPQKYSHGLTLKTTSAVH